MIDIKKHTYTVNQVTNDIGNTVMPTVEAIYSLAQRGAKKACKTFYSKCHNSVSQTFSHFVGEYEPESVAGKVKYVAEHAATGLLCTAAAGAAVYSASYLPTVKMVGVVFTSSFIGGCADHIADHNTTYDFCNSDFEIVSSSF